eukprot:5650985-Amphidinium_carterae.1
MEKPCSSPPPATEANEDISCSRVPGTHPTIPASVRTLSSAPETPKTMTSSACVSNPGESLGFSDASPLAPSRASPGLA